jgi:hypothetical protein
MAIFSTACRFMVLTLWTCQFSSLSRGFTGRLIRPGANETAPVGNSPGRPPESACSLLPGNHSPGQGSRKPRRRVYVPGSLRRLARGHVSRVSRRSEAGNRIFRRIRRPGRTVPRSGPGRTVPRSGPDRMMGLMAWMPRSCCLSATSVGLLAPWPGRSGAQDARQSQWHHRYRGLLHGCLAHVVRAA